MTTPNAGWHPDPADPNLDRWWDGRQWTDRSRPRGTTAATAAEARNGKRIGAIVLGVLVVAGIAFAAKSVANQPSEEEQAAAAAATSSRDAASDRAYQEQLLLTRAEMTCQELVTGSLKSPGTAEFVDVTTKRRPDNKIVTTGSVDSQNGFGAMVRSSFTCTTVNERTTLDFIG
ncbi:DUF2510 domain-containing protein [Rhodococcus aetherivorans]|uniref:DUF2510 domain-containing protein n=1 Tax=Rhodococcus aetherivorans TaxID=191292 RepID=UPI000A90494D|nr:DUF2510 domain-containing protein [Rhodococcus aetherivorans]